jgi:hypothetical protein
VIRANPGPPLSGLSSQATVPVGSAVALTTATPANITSLSLGPGTYLIWAQVDYALNAATSTEFKGGISSVSTAFPSQAGGGGVGPDALTIFPLGVTALTDTVTHIVGPTLLTIAAQTTIFLVAQGIFSAGAVSAYGTLSAIQLNLP